MRFLNIASAVAIAASALLVTSDDAFAQRNRGGSGGVVVVDYQRVLRESALGRDMQAKIQVIGQQIGQELQALGPEGQALEAENTRLTNATRNMTPEQRVASTTYGPQIQALAQRAQAFQQRRAIIQGDAECTQAIALRDVGQQVMPVVQAIMAQRGATVVMDTANLHYSAPEADITATVIQQLDQNAGTRAANVTRQSYQACMQQPAAAPAAGQ